MVFEKSCNRVPSAQSKIRHVMNYLKRKPLNHSTNPTRINTPKVTFILITKVNRIYPREMKPEPKKQSHNCSITINIWEITPSYCNSPTALNHRPITHAKPTKSASPAQGHPNCPEGWIVWRCQSRE